MVVLRPDEELSELESLSMTIKTMFCKREKVQILRSQENSYAEPREEDSNSPGGNTVGDITKDKHS